MGKQSVDALLVAFITNFDTDMMDATVAYCIVLYCNHLNERIASCGSVNNCDTSLVTRTMDSVYYLHLLRRLGSVLILV